MSTSKLQLGLGLRSQHYEYIIRNNPAIDFFEIISENYFNNKYEDELRTISSKYPLTMHGLSMSIGSYTKLNWDYLYKIKDLIHKVHPLFVSDHLSFTTVGNIDSHILLPLPYTDSMIKFVAKKIKIVQDFLETPLLLENISSHIDYSINEITEPEFIAAVAEEANSYILLDINNLYVNSYNKRFDPISYLSKLPKNRIKQYHIAGHQNCRTYLMDSHDGKIHNNVWDLYRNAVKLFGIQPTVIERDKNIPTFPVLMEEVGLLRKILLEFNDS